jgi:hypothetical protein
MDIRTCCRDAGCDYIVLNILTGNVQNKKHDEFAGLLRLFHLRRFVCKRFVTLDRMSFRRFVRKRFVTLYFLCRYTFCPLAV